MIKIRLDYPIISYNYQDNQATIFKGSLHILVNQILL